MQRHDSTLGGSSPRTRGTRFGFWYLRSIKRFIPADAGNTIPTRVRYFGFPVHPRGRGEHGLTEAYVKLTAGSSPRTRGTLDDAIAEADRLRFIPADAGNTGSTTWNDPARPVHPRGRGEHTTFNVLGGSLGGSSPRTRGTRAHPRHRPRQHRFIPADAGNTHPIAGAVRFTAVHPRGRGEHAVPPLLSAIYSGSSPRTRGTRPACRDRPPKRRFIPADAGNT